MFFLRQMAGFLLQLLPCIVLCMRAFHKEQYRIPLRILSVGGMGVLLGISFGFACVMNTVTGNAVYQYSNMIMLATAALCAVCFLIVVSAHIVQKLMTLCVCVTYEVAVFMTGNTCVRFFPEIESGAWDIYTWKILLIWGIVTIVTFLPMDCFIKRVLLTYFEDTDLKSLKRGALLLGAITCLFFLVTAMGTVLFGGSGEVFMIRAVYYLYSVFCIGVVYWFLFWEIRQVRKQEGVFRQLEIQQLQYEKLRNSVQNTFRMQHDMRQQYRVLARLLTENKVEEALTRIEKGAGFVEQIEQRQFCKNPGINALFQHYSSEAEREGISLHITIDALPKRIDELLLTNLLGNMMENAIYSCKNAAQPGYVKLKMGMVKNIFAVYMENTCEEVRMTGKGKPNAEGYYAASCFGSLKSGRGFGLESMEAIAEKYGGIAEFCFQKSVFYTRISMRDESNIE